MLSFAELLFLYALLSVLTFRVCLNMRLERRTIIIGWFIISSLVIWTMLSKNLSLIQFQESMGDVDEKEKITTCHTVNSSLLVEKPTSNKTPDSFFFIHVPKTGTSLFAVLRNSLEACTEKHFTCFGVLGGGYHREQTKNNKAVYPYNAKVMFGENITKEEELRINTCSGKLPNCVYNYHCDYKTCGKHKNKVTMIRNPYKWLPSYAHWMAPYLASGGTSLETMLPFQSPMDQITNTTNVDEAIDILQNDYIWWGISDYWEVSVCTFHCKFGGITTDIELQNTRSATSSWYNGNNETIAVKTLEDYRVKVPLVEELIPNFTEYVDMHYKKDVILYSRLLELFWERADLCGCLSLQMKQEHCKHKL